MRSKHSQSPNEKPPHLVLLENGLLVAVLGLIALRATVIENPHIEQTFSFLTSEMVSIFISTVLLACFAIWLFVLLLTNQFRWKKTSLGVAVGLFVLAGVISVLAASNKRAAVTDVVLLATPMVSAVFLVQLLSSRQKIRMALLLVIAVGAAAAFQCIDQFTASNEAMIQDYEQNPAEQLQTQGIEPDSLEHWMYEHRLYSKGIRGFLMTSNSAASFFLLASFAALGLCVESFRKRNNPETRPACLCYGLAFFSTVGGLVITQSKGGNGAFLIGMTAFVLLGFFGKRLWKYRRVVGILLLTGMALTSAAIVTYGLQHGRLPGGNSMLVRWQYWQSAVAMIGDHFWTGVGGGNFTFWYPLYKNPAASETIQDPHNVILSLLSQYGPLGLAAFLAAVLRPIFTCLRHLFAPSDPLPEIPAATNKKLWIGLLAVSAGLLLVVRPHLMSMASEGETLSVRMAAYVWLYLLPAGIFALAMGLLSAVSTTDVSVQGRNEYLMLAIVCGLAAVLIHNLIDFAIFEPGVWNTFWLFIAILAAAIHTNSVQDNKPIWVSAPARLFMGLGLVIILMGYLLIAVIAPAKAAILFNRAGKTASFEEFEHEIQGALTADTLSPDSAYDAAGMLMQVYALQPPESKDVSLLEKAAEYAEAARRRNPANFKPYRLAGDMELLLAAQSKQEAKYMQPAYAAYSQALDRYPGSDRIHFALGQIAEKLHRPQAALAHYQKALDIEAAYQAQFKIMYPGRDPVISRLGNTNTTIAKAKIEELKKQLQE